MQAANNNNGCVQNGATTANGAAENGHGEGNEMGTTTTTAVTLSQTNQDIVRLIGQYLKNEGLK